MPAMISPSTPHAVEFSERYEQARTLARFGQIDAARALLSDLKSKVEFPAFRAVLENDLTVLDVVDHRTSEMSAGFLRALEWDPDCSIAQENLNFLAGATAAISPPDGSSLPPVREGKTRVAIVSLLFNWPSTGGGTVHTYEVAKFLSLAGYQVQHIFAQYAEWGVGTVSQPLAVDAVPLVFTPDEWNATTIQARFRQAVDEFHPDFVIVTDSWNSKPLLAEAVSSYPYFIRIAALECLCPLNNVRMLIETGGEVRQCDRHQLADRDHCRACVASRGMYSGALHREERALSLFDSDEYGDRLKTVVANAEAVLVVNPTIGDLVQPFAKRVCVVPSGFDPIRFPTPTTRIREATHPKRIFFAGLAQEFMKGFHILHAAAERLWRWRRDFEIVATVDPVGQHDEFTRFIGWQSQDDLPAAIRDADILVFPTIAQEALGRSAVEAMACGRPVVASRIGGLPWVVDEGTTGLLFTPGDAKDLAAKLEILLDNDHYCRQLGRAGRKKFEREFTWDVIIDRHYRELLSIPSRGAASAP